MEAIRLNKYLSEAGVCSRREADRLIEAGEITVNGKPAEMGMKVTDDDEILCRGRRIGRDEAPVLIAFNKPTGVVCTTARDEPDNIIDYIGYPSRVYPVGRLDKDSEGLILLTNQGEMMDDILRGRNRHEKEYVVTINRMVTDEFLEQMQSGVHILDTVTRPCKAEKISHHRFRIILTQGLNRQIRRMCEALGCRVTSLRRVRIMNIELGSLKPGTWRKIEGEELAELKRELAGKSGKGAVQGKPGSSSTRGRRPGEKTGA